MNKLILFLFFSLVMPIQLLQASGEAHTKVKYFKEPVREFSIILTGEGYYPNRMVAYVGEKVRFFVTSTKKESECFLLQDHKVFLSAKMGEVSEGEVLLKEAGKYKFYCPSSKHHGFLTVIEKASHVEEQKRKIASEAKEEAGPSYWTPRDYDE